MDNEPSVSMGDCVGLAKLAVACVESCRDSKDGISMGGVV